MIDGEKMFTTLAQVADYVFVLTRTNPDVKKHRGLTTFLVPTTSAGFSISEVKTLGGERTNITTYEGVRIPDSLRVGEVDQGWSVASAALELEHSGSYVGETLEVLAVAVEQASRPGADGSRLIDDPSVRARLAQAAIEAEMSDLLGMRAGWMHQVGQRPLVEGSMAKVYSSEGVLSGHQRDPRRVRPGIAPTGPRPRGRDPDQDRARLPSQPGDPDLCRNQRDPPEYHRRGRVGPPSDCVGG